MNTNYTDITILLDRSGSMSTIKQKTLEGLNIFLSEQKTASIQSAALTPERMITFDLNEGQPVRCRVTLIQFASGVFIKTLDAVDVDTIEPLKDVDYQPDGGTPLWQSMCRAIDETGVRFTNMKEEDRPGRVIFVTVTDGEETFHTPPVEDVARRVKHQEELYNWQFIYQGANQDAILVATQMGMQSHNAMSYAPTNTGTKMSYSALSNTVLRKRCVDTADMASTGYLIADYASSDEELSRIGYTTNAGTSANINPVTSTTAGPIPTVMSPGAERLNAEILNKVLYRGINP